MFNWKDKTDEQIAKFVVGNHGRLKRRREIYDDLRRTIVKIFRPRRHDILGDGQGKGKQYGAKVYDQNPANMLQKFVSGKIGYMVNRSIPWLQFISSDRRLMKLDHVKKYFQEVAEQALYATGRSTFYTAVAPHTLDADSIGTSVMVPMEDEQRDRIVFDTVHPRDSFIATDRFGEAVVYHRPLRLTRMTAEQTFGKDKLPSNWYKDGQLKDPFQKEDKYIWAMYPNDDRDIDSDLPEDRAYIVFCVMMTSRAGKSRLVYRNGRTRFVVCCRSGRESGADYGTSIAADCLTAALQVNKLGEKALVAAHRMVEPPVVASKSLRATLYKNPGSTTWVDDIQREGVKTWMDRQPWPITDAQMDRLHNQIEDRMFIKFFEMLSAGDLKVKTAYEVSQMMAEKATLMSSVVDTFEQETLIPSVMTIVDAETRAGRMPEPPEELIITGGRVDIIFLGPLAQLQRSLLRGKGILESIDIIARMMDLSPKVGWKFNWMEMAEEVAVAQGMPQRLVLSDEEVALIAQEAAQDEQMMKTAALAEQFGKAAPGLGKAPEEGSPIALLTEGTQEAG